MSREYLSKCHFCYEVIDAGDTEHFHFELRDSEYSTRKPHVFICLYGMMAGAVLILDGARPTSVGKLKIKYDKAMMRALHEGFKRPISFTENELEEILEWAVSPRQPNVTNWEFYREVYRDFEMKKIHGRRELHEIESSRVGFLDKNGWREDPAEFSVCVLDNDVAQIPHVHIVTEDGSRDSCVLLETANYFNRDDDMTELDDEYVDALDKFMNTPGNQEDYIHYQNKYEYACRLWNHNNCDSPMKIKYDKDGRVIVPDYKELKIRRPQ